MQGTVNSIAYAEGCNPPKHYEFVIHLRRNNDLPFLYDIYEFGLLLLVPHIMASWAINQSLGVLDRDPKLGYVLLIQCMGTHRLIIKDQQLLKCIVAELCDQGLPVHVVDLEAVSFEEQVRVFAGTSVIIEVHDADLTNLLYLPCQERTYLKS